MTSIRPSEVRGRILKDHDALRRKIGELASVTHALRGGDEGAVGHAVSLCQRLVHELWRHLDLKDAVLEPALRESDAWGPIRADDLMQRHAAKRDQLRSITEQSHEEHTPASLAAVLDPLIESLREDLVSEEQEVLTPELLCDDVTSSGEDG